MKRTRSLAALLTLALLSAACSPVSFGGSDGSPVEESAASSPADIVQPSQGQEGNPVSPDSSPHHNFNEKLADVLISGGQPLGQNQFTVTFKVLGENNQPVPFMFKPAPYKSSIMESYSYRYVDNALIIDIKASGPLEGTPKFYIRLLQPNTAWEIRTSLPDGTVLDDGGVIQYLSPDQAK